MSLPLEEPLSLWHRLKNSHTNVALTEARISEAQGEALLLKAAPYAHTFSIHH